MGVVVGEAMSEDKPKRPIRTYVVTDKFGNKHEFDAHFMFNNAGELIFRMTDEEDGRSNVVAVFPTGEWSNCVRARRNENEQGKEGQPGSGQGDSEGV